MKKPELYQKTVDILVDAYFNDTLKHRDCAACAVGNMVAYNMGIKYKKDGGQLDWENCEPNWGKVFITTLKYQQISEHEYCGRAKVEIDSTGYTWRQLAKIEKAFESVDRADSDDEWMFNGLMAVIDVLDEIHENNDAAATDAAKKRFQKSFS